MKKLVTILAVLAITTTAWGQFYEFQDFSAGALPAGWSSNNGTELFVPVAGVSDSSYDNVSPGVESAGPSLAMDTVGGGGHFDPVVASTPQTWDTPFTLNTGIEDFPADGSNIEFGPDLGANMLDVTDFAYRTGSNATHIASMIKVAVVNDGSTQSVIAFGPSWGGFGAQPDYRHYLVNEGCLVDYQDLDNDQAVMEFNTARTSTDFRPGGGDPVHEPHRQQLVLASGLPLGAIDVQLHVNPRSGGVADETINFLNGDTIDMESMQQEYIDASVQITDSSGNVILDKNGSTTHDFGVARVPWSASWYGGWAYGIQYFGGGQFDYAEINLSGDTTNALVAYDPSTYMVSRAGDATRDGAVDGLDISKLVNGFGVSDKWDDGDFNGDGVVDGLDISILVNQFGVSYASEPLSTTVPEPATMALLGLGGLAVLRRRRK